MGRLKMISITLTRPRPSMTSSTVPSKFSNGPSLILTRSPRSTSMRTLGVFGGRLLLLLVEHLVDFGLGHLGRGSVGPDEVADAGRLAHHEPGLLVELHLDHDVAGVGLALHDPFLVVANLGDLFGGNDDLAEKTLEALDLDPALEGVADGVLAGALHLEHVPDQFGRGLVVIDLRAAAAVGGCGAISRAAGAAATAGGSAATAFVLVRGRPPSGVCSSHLDRGVEGYAPPSRPSVRSPSGRAGSEARGSNDS